MGEAPHPRITGDPTQLFLRIDEHAHQLTVSLRNGEWDIILARQISIRSAKVQAFFDQLTQRCARESERFVAVVEVCGFNDWLIQLLREASILANVS